jgi:Transposase IS66 family
LAPDIELGQITVPGGRPAGSGLPAESRQQYARLHDTVLHTLENVAVRYAYDLGHLRSFASDLSAQGAEITTELLAAEAVTPADVGARLGPPGEVLLRPVAGSAGLGRTKGARLVAPAVKAITAALVRAEVAHFDESGFCTAGKLLWVHSASSGRWVLVTVHPKRGKDGMEAAGVLPAFAEIAVHDAWKPYDSFAGIAGHALCGAHLLRELAAVTEAGTALDQAWARQAIDALLASRTPRTPPAPQATTPLTQEALDRQAKWYADPATASDGSKHSRKPSTATLGSPTPP